MEGIFFTKIENVIYCYDYNFETWSSFDNNYICGNPFTIAKNNLKKNDYNYSNGHGNFLKVIQQALYAKREKFNPYVVDFFLIEHLRSIIESNENKNKNIKNTKNKIQLICNFFSISVCICSIEIESFHNNDGHLSKIEDIINPVIDGQECKPIITIIMGNFYHYKNGAKIDHYQLIVSNIFSTNGEILLTNVKNHNGELVTYIQYTSVLSKTKQNSNSNNQSYGDQYDCEQSCCNQSYGCVQFKWNSFEVHLGSIA